MLTKDGKAAGPDEVQSEIIKLFDENLKKIIFNVVCNSSKIPKEWLRSEFVLPKKREAKKCSDYRIISFMSH